MIDVVVVYDRTAASVIDQAVYVDDSAAAFAKRLELERAHRKRGDVEVVLLSALSLEHLKISHARYFDPTSIRADKYSHEIERLLNRAS
ncbi:MAG TPA: hypothetical protein VN224_10350 [Xanthomonadales bacterium]|nr:hypothetical protein [Xanthomonadales bacterium]